MSVVFSKCNFRCSICFAMFEPVFHALSQGFLFRAMSVARLTLLWLTAGVMVSVFFPSTAAKLGGQVPVDLSGTLFHSPVAYVKSSATKSASFFSTQTASSCAADHSL